MTDSQNCGSLHQHWKSTYETMKNQFCSLQEQISKTNAESVCLTAFHEAKSALHRAKGLSLQSEDPNTQDWLLKMERAVEDVFDCEKPSKFLSVFREVQNSVDTGPQDVSFNYIDPSEKIPLEELKKLASESLAFIEWSQQLLPRLDKFKLNLLRLSVQEGYNISAKSFRLPLESIKKLEKLTSSEPDLRIIDIWPKVEGAMVTVKCVLLHKNEPPEQMFENIFEQTED